MDFESIEELSIHDYLQLYDTGDEHIAECACIGPSDNYNQLCVSECRVSSLSNCEAICRNLGFAFSFNYRPSSDLCHNSAYLPGGSWFCRR